MFKLPGHAHRQLIGYIGLVLPILLILLALARGATGPGVDYLTIDFA